MKFLKLGNVCGFMAAVLGVVLLPAESKAQEWEWAKTIRPPPRDGRVRGDDNRVAVLPDGKSLVIKTARHIRYFEARGEYKSGEELSLSWDVGGTFSGLAIDPSGKYVAAVNCVRNQKDTLLVWSAGSAKERLRFGGLPEVCCLAFSPGESRILVAGLRSGAVTLWDLNNEKNACTIKKDVQVHDEGKACLAVTFHPDGKRFATGGDDGRLKLWRFDGEKVSELAAPDGHKGSVRAVAFSPDGKLLVSVGGDKVGEVKLWAVDRDRLRYRRGIEGHEGPVACVAFAPDGRSLVTGGEDRTLRFWDAEAGRASKKFDENGRHEAPIRSVAYSKDGKMLLSADSDGIVKVWKQSGEE